MTPSGLLVLARASWIERQVDLAFCGQAGRGHRDQCLRWLRLWRGCGCR